MMPPAGRPRPDRAAASALASRLETALDRAEAAHPDPGGPLLHRLNRAEYANAIRDLLALDIDASALLPPDDSSAGFDNVADVLGVSPALMERYLSAADQVSALAVGDPAILPALVTYHVRGDTSQSDHVDGLPLGTRGGLMARPTLPLDGEYTIKVKLLQTNLGSVRGLEYPQQLEISVDGARVHLVPMGGPADFAILPENAEEIADALDARLVVRVPDRGRPARDRRDVRAADRRARRPSPAAVPAQQRRSRPITRASRTSRASRSPVRSARRRPATRRAGDGCSAAGR